MIKFYSTKVLELGSCAFRQWKAADNRPNAGDNASRCSKVHGYLLTAKFIFGSSKLDERNWVVDFGGLGELKDKLKYWFDHTLCLAANDPCLEDFKQLHNKGAVDLRVFEKGVGIERTAEFCYELATQFLKEKFGEGYWVEQVEVFEHDKNSAIFTNLRVTIEGIQQQLVESNTQSQQPAPQPVPQPVAQPAVQQRTPRPAPINNPVSTGKSDWFKGTTWG